MEAELLNAAADNNPVGGNASSNWLHDVEEYREILF